MMKTTQDALTVVYKLISTSALKTMITGAIYKTVRPYSGKEDITINCLPITGMGQGAQKCTVNVNIHLPAQKLEQNGKVTNTPNELRFNALLAVAVPLLQQWNGENYTAWIANQSNPMPEEEVSEFYINLRIEFRYLTFK